MPEVIDTEFVIFITNYFGAGVSIVVDIDIKNMR